MGLDGKLDIDEFSNYFLMQSVADHDLSCYDFCCLESQLAEPCFVMY